MPKAAIAIAAVVVIALGVAGAGFATGWFGLGGPEVKESVNDYTWDELSQISDIISKKSDQDQALEVAKKYHLTTDDGKLDGTQTKDIELSDGTTAKAMIAGFDHDDKSDGSGKAGISFIFTNGVAVKAMFNQSTLDERGAQNDLEDISWATSDLRTWLESDFLETLPTDLRDAIKPVDKKSGGFTATKSAFSADSDYDGESYGEWVSPQYGYADPVTTSDSLWIPSLCEVIDGAKDGGSISSIQSAVNLSFNDILDSAGSIDGVIESEEYQKAAEDGKMPRYLEEGSQYQLYEDAGVRYGMTNSIFGQAENGEGVGWWTRSIKDFDHGFSEPTFRAIGQEGGEDGSGAGSGFPYAHNDENVGVVPGFCV